MLKRPLTWLGLVGLAALIPLAVAYGEDEGAPKEKPTKAAAPDDRSARFFERFDLDGSGTVTWEEFQKVRSGFARLDVSGDGAIDASDLEAVHERRREARDGRGRPGARRGRMAEQRMRGRRGMDRMDRMDRMGGPRGMRGMHRNGMRGGPGMHRGPGMTPPPWMDGPGGMRGGRGMRGGHEPMHQRGPGRGPGRGPRRGGEGDCECGNRAADPTDE